MKRFARALHRIQLLASLVVVAAMATLSTAAEVETTANSRAILFDLRGLDDLGVDEFDGGLGLRYYVVDGLSLRASIGFAWSEQVLEETERDDIPYSESKNIHDGFDLSFVVEKRLPVKGDVAPYLGIGLEMQRRTDVSLLSIPAQPEDGMRLKQVAKNRSIGTLFVVGFEIAAMDGITLGAEYQLSYSREIAERVIYRQNETPEELPDQTLRMSGLSTTSLYLAVSF